MPTFNIPADYNVPSGVKEGVEFTDVATFKYDGDKMMLITVGEDKTPIEGYEKETEKKAEKPKGAKQAIKEQLSAMEDKSGSEEMEDTDATK